MKGLLKFFIINSVCILNEPFAYLFFIFHDYLKFSIASQILQSGKRIYRRKTNRSLIEPGVERASETGNKSVIFKIEGFVSGFPHPADKIATLRESNKFEKMNNRHWKRYVIILYLWFKVWTGKTRWCRGDQIAAPALLTLLGNRVKLIKFIGKVCFVLSETLKKKKN